MRFTAVVIRLSPVLHSTWSFLAHCAFYVDSASSVFALSLLVWRRMFFHAMRDKLGVCLCYCRVVKICEECRAVVLSAHCFSPPPSPGRWSHHKQARSQVMTRNKRNIMGSRFCKGGCVVNTSMQRAGRLWKKNKEVFVKWPIKKLF